MFKTKICFAILCLCCLASIIAANQSINANDETASVINRLLIDYSNHLEQLRNNSGGIQFAYKETSEFVCENPDFNVEPETQTAKVYLKNDINLDAGLQFKLELTGMIEKEERYAEVLYQDSNYSFASFGKSNEEEHLFITEEKSLSLKDIISDKLQSLNNTFGYIVICNQGKRSCECVLSLLQKSQNTLTLDEKKQNNETFHTLCLELESGRLYITFRSSFKSCPQTIKFVAYPDKLFLYDYKEYIYNVESVREFDDFVLPEKIAISCEKAVPKGDNAKRLYNEHTDALQKATYRLAIDDVLLNNKKIEKHFKLGVVSSIPDGVSVQSRNDPQNEDIWMDGEVVPKTDERMLAIARQHRHKFFPGPNEPRFWLITIGLLLILAAGGIQIRRHLKSNG